MGRNSPEPDAAPVGSHRSIGDPRRRANSSTAISDSRPKATPPLPQRSFRSHNPHTGRRRFWNILPFRGRTLQFYLLLLLSVSAFAMFVLQSWITLGFRQPEGTRRSAMKFGSSLEFVPRKLNGRRLDWLRNQPRIGIRPPKLCLIIGNLKKDPPTLMLYSVMKNLKDRGYVLKIYALGDGRALSTWQEIGGQVSILSPERYGYIDWSIFEGVVVDSLEAKDAISSLMQEPFCSVPLIWIIQEDTLANRLQVYQDMGWDHLIANWRTAFSRADVMVFPEFSFPMLYSVLDTGNFLVIPGSPVDIWAAEIYSRIRSKSQLRTENGFNDDDLLVLIVGSSFFYNELAWDYAVDMHILEPLLLEYAGSDMHKFVFLCGNSSSDYSDALQAVATRLGLKEGSLKHYGITNDVNGMILMVDVVVYGSSQDEQGFPPLLSRAMSFGVPVIAPDYHAITKYVVNGVHGIIFPKNDPDALKTAFSRVVSEGKVSRFAKTIASSGKLLAKNMFAAECISGYAKLVEDVFHFPSDAMLPDHDSQLNHSLWQWSLFKSEIEQISSDFDLEDSQDMKSIVYELEEDMIDFTSSKNGSQHNAEDVEQDFPTTTDWDILREIESSEDVERLEREEVDERMEKEIGQWDDIYRNARKAEKLKFELNERDEGELERTGQPVCIYEIYNGAGGWPFLHHGSLYRGLSLYTGARRQRSDDVDAVGRLSILNDTYIRNILCEIGGMFAIANGVDNIHKRPWIGFQSWRAAGKKVSLLSKAERVLEKTIQDNTKGDVIYFWARLDMDSGTLGSNDRLTFWSTCDIMNGGRCRTAFEDAFRKMYGLPSNVEALPPMPEDGGHWSALHSWVMPTPSYLEFIMFSRIFVDSLHSLHINSSKMHDCSLGFSAPEKQHCYCRLLELLVNVWAYHSARKMVFIHPHTGVIKEQHPVEQRKGFMWAKYFNNTLLKSMDEDLAEAADDDDSPYEKWLWPLTGEVYWQGIYEREREERYRLKMDKKRKTKEKLLERLKHGYKQKSLGG